MKILVMGDILRSVDGAELIQQIRAGVYGDPRDNKTMSLAVIKGKCVIFFFCISWTSRNSESPLFLYNYN